MYENLFVAKMGRVWVEDWMEIFEELSLDCYANDHIFLIYLLTNSQFFLYEGYICHNNEHESFEQLADCLIDYHNSYKLYGNCYFN